MAISSIGNLTFINQNSQIGATQQANVQHQADIANVANMQDFQDKLNDIQEVRKLEENEAINPDADSEKNRREQEEEQREREQEHHTHEEKLEAPQIHLLDIKA